MAMARRLWILVVAVLASGAATAALAQTALETEVKATFLYKFAPFVGWPASAFDNPASPFTICVVGSDPFGSVLDRAVAGQAVGGRAIQVRRMGTLDKTASCQIVYADGPAVAKTLKALHGQPVLTVTDGPAAPGIIDFTIDQGRVRFRIDDAEAAACNLTISSKLLSLALSVKARKGAGS